MSVWGRTTSKQGPGHDGAPKRGFFAAKDAPGLAVHHGPSFTSNTKHPRTGNIARDGAPKRHLDVSVHNGMKRQPAGGLGHAQGAAPVDDGGNPVAAGVHPFAKPASNGFKHDKLAPVKSGMRNRKNDFPHGGASPASDCSSGDAANVLSEAHPLHPNFRGKTFDCGD
jgi:hypothetical protein